MKERNELAKLKDEFFQLPVNTQLWEQLKSVADWSPQMLPVHEWDGVVFIACIEPNKEINWSFPVQYVLASSENLNNYWQSLNTIQSEEPEAPVLEEPVAEEEPSDSPIGLSEEAPSAPVLQLDSLKLLQEEAPSEEAVAEEPALAPEPVAEEAPKVPSTPPPPSNYDTGTSAHEITRVASVLDILKNDFEGAILLTYEGENELKPLVWDSAWKPKDGAKGPENLKDASAFRVVARTKHPYLGHVVDTPVNRKFFEAWGITEFPEKILVQPIVSGGGLIAVVVCICNPEVKNQVLLGAATRHAEEILRMLQDDSQASAA